MRSVHQKSSAYAAKHKIDSQQTHYRAWKSGKKWLYAASTLVLFTGALSGAIETLFPMAIHAATGNTFGTGTSALVPGTTTYTAGSPAVTTANAGLTTTTPYVWNGNASFAAGTTWGNFGQLTTTANQAGDMLVGTQFDATKSISFSAYVKHGTSSTAMDNNGTWMGFIFTPLTASAVPAPQATNNDNYGISSGMPSSFFLGRDLYNTPSVDGGGTQGQSNNIAIRSTNAAGTLISGSTNSGWPTASVGVGNIKNPATNSDTGASIPQNNATELMAFSWTPSGPASGGLVPGTMTVTVNGTSISYTTNVSLLMTIGMTAANGGTASNMSVSLPTETIKASLPTAPVTVNYIKSGTTQSLAAPSTVTANVGDTVGVTAPGTTASSTANAYPKANTYTDVAPTFTGYTFSSVTANTAVAATGGTITVYYTAVAQTANVWYSAASSVQSSAASSINATRYSEAGVTDGVIYSAASGFASSASSNAAALSTAGYSVSYVYNGSSYATLSSAYAAAKGPAGAANTFTAYTNSGTSYAATSGGVATQLTNDVLAVVSANSETATYSYAWSSGTPGWNGTAGNLQGTLATSSTASGTAGQALPNYTPATPPNGYVLYSITAPNGKTYTPYVNAGVNPGVANYSLSGTTLTLGTDTFTVPSGTAAPTSLWAAIQLAFPNYTASNSFTFNWGAAKLAWNFYYQYDTGLKGGGKLTIGNSNTSLNWYNNAQYQYTNMNGGLAGSGYLTGAPMANLSNTPGYWLANYAGYTQGGFKGVLPQGTYIEGYKYGSDTTLYTTFAALAAKYPYLTYDHTGPWAPQMNVILGYDSSAIKSTPTVGLAKTANWTPASAITSDTNGDGTVDLTGAMNNGNPIGVIITDSSGNQVWTGSSTDSMPAGTLAPGTYTVTYMGTQFTLPQSPQGVTQSNVGAPKSTTTLVVTDFVLPFAGGEGMMGLIGLAGSLTVAGVALKFGRRRAVSHSTGKLRLTLARAPGIHRRS